MANKRQFAIDCLASGVVTYREFRSSLKGAITRAVKHAREDLLPTCGAPYAIVWLRRDFDLIKIADVLPGGECRISSELSDRADKVIKHALEELYRQQETAQELLAMADDAKRIGEELSNGE